MDDKSQDGLVRIRDLRPGSLFETTLTHRSGVVVEHAGRGCGTVVTLSPLKGSEPEERKISPHVRVRFIGYTPRVTQGEHERHRSRPAAEAVK